MPKSTKSKGLSDLARQNGRSRQREWQLAQKAAGNCVQCGRKRERNAAHCVKCQKKANQWKYESRRSA